MRWNADHSRHPARRLDDRELIILAGALIASALVDAGYSFLLGLARFRPHAVVTSSASWFYAALLAVTWQTVGLTVARAMIVWTVAQALRGLALIFACARDVRPGRPELSLLRESIEFGLRAWVGTLARFFTFRLDQILMAYISSQAALGIYAVAVNASEVLLYLPQATASAILPLISACDPERRVEETVRAFRSLVLIAAAGLVVACALGPLLLPLIFGDAYKAAVVPFLWLLPSTFGYAALGVFSSALLAAEAPGLSSLGPLVSLVLGVVLDLVLIPPFQATGAAAAATASFVAGGIVALILYRQREPFEWRLLVVPTLATSRSCERWQAPCGLGPSRTRECRDMATTSTAPHPPGGRPEPAVTDDRTTGKTGLMGDYAYWSDSRAGDDEPVDTARYISALKRGFPLMALIVVTLTGAVLGLSLLLPKTYEATARIVINDSPTSAPAGDVETVKRRLATVQALLTTRDVLSRAAQRLSGAGASPETIQHHVRSSVDRDANIIDVVADDGDPKGAAAIANAVALSFLEMRRAQERRLLDDARAQLTATVEQLRGTPGSAAEMRALRERLSELGVSRATIGTDLDLAQDARAPSSSASPRPIRNAVFAFFAAGFIAVLAALGIDQLAPRLSGARQLSRMIRVPILATVPRPRRRPERWESDDEMFGALEASLATQLPSARNVVLIASAFRRDGKSDLAARLAWTLARAGHRTLLVCGDVRDPEVHQALGVADAPGFTDLLAAVSGDESVHASEGGRSRAKRVPLLAPLIDDAITTLRDPNNGVELDVLPPGGSKSPRLVADDACATLFERLRRSAHRFVVVDGPPLVGAIDGQLLTRYVDGVAVVCRCDRMSPTSAAELGDVLAQLPTPVLGAIAVGCSDVIPHVLTGRTDRGQAPRSRTRTRAPSAN